MRVVILAGGRGTRLAEETSIRPKPIVEIGDKPILWHLMNIYSHYGHKDFLVACGYKGEISAVRGKLGQRTVSLYRSMSYGLFCPGTI